MQAQDTTELVVFKLWPWIEANWKRLLTGLGVVVVAVMMVSFWSWNKSQKEVTAGMALTELSLSVAANTTASQLADNYLKVAHDQPGTLAGERAQIQGAATLFEAKLYSDAQAQFQNYLDAHPDGIFATTARLGVASSLEAQGKMDLAVAAYEKVAGGTADALTVAAAKFALGRINQQQGKLAEAELNYEDATRSINPNSSLASEAGIRASELKAKLAAAKPVAAAPAMSLTPVPAK